MMESGEQSVAGGGRKEGHRERTAACGGEREAERRWAGQASALPMAEAVGVRAGVVEKVGPDCDGGDGDVGAVGAAVLGRPAELGRRWLRACRRS